MSRDDRVEHLYQWPARDLAERVVELEELLKGIWNDFVQDGLPHTDTLQEILLEVYREGYFGEFGDHLDR